MTEKEEILMWKKGQKSYKCYESKVTVETKLNLTTVYTLQVSLWFTLQKYRFEEGPIMN